MLHWFSEEMVTARSASHQENVMIKLILGAMAFILFVGTTSMARAQVTLDVAKVTCEQFRSYKITRPENIAIWLSGYYQGKRGDTTLDTQSLMANARKLQTYCGRNPQTPVMQAVETLFGKAQ
jgi:acid stress chaperone HdeB